MSRITTVINNKNISKNISQEISKNILNISSTMGLLWTYSKITTTVLFNNNSYGKIEKENYFINIIQWYSVGKNKVPFIAFKIFTNYNTIKNYILII